tara:strand:- start:770 stop:988 length:219 start_codon:yes stop_codon:yes gene_type:complete
MVTVNFTEILSREKSTANPWLKCHSRFMLNLVWYPGIECRVRKNKQNKQIDSSFTLKFFGTIVRSGHIHLLY